MGMRILVFGGRDWTDQQLTFRVLDKVHRERGISWIIHGGARGADTMAGDWAQDRKVPFLRFNANWSGDGKAAGPLRNQRMLDQGKPNAGIGFPGGRGTADMAARLRKALIPVWFPAGE